MQAAQNGKPNTNPEYSYDKWKTEDKKFELAVLAYLLYPLKRKIFEDPDMLECGTKYDRLAILRELGADWISNEQLAHKFIKFPDLHGFGEVKLCFCADPDDEDSDGGDPDPCRRCYRRKEE